MFTDWYNRASLCFGDGLCHQLPERSFFVADIIFPVCARCTGIYVGFTFVLIALLVHYRQTRPSRGLALAAYVIIAVGVAGMAWDGISSYASIRETSNLLRLVTGVGFGSALATVVYLMLADTLFASRGEGLVLGDARGIAVLITAAGAGVGVVLLLDSVSVPIGPVFVAVSAVATFSAVGTGLAALHPRFRHSVVALKDATRPVAVGLLVGVAGIALTKGLQRALDLLSDTLI